MENKVQVLITTMRLESPEDLLKRMNISTEFLIGNQCIVNEDKEFSFKKNKGLIISRNAKGVGRNRNELLNQACCDYCVLADDDMVFYDNYSEIVCKEFERNKDADVLIFNLDTENTLYASRKNAKTRKVNLFNYMNYGAARVAFRLSSIKYNGLFFNTMFGGGTPHKCGEDSLFLRDCLRKKLKVCTVSKSIAKLEEIHESSWFDGFNEKYFFDKGVFLALAHSRLCKLFARYLVMRHKEYLSSKMTRKDIYREILNGIKFVKKTKFKRT